MRLSSWLTVVALIALTATTASAEVYVNVPPVSVTIAPPPMRTEVRPVAPSASHIWIAGHWAWRGNSHVWLPGHWAMAPAPGYVWEQARWVQQGGQWVFFEGHWRQGTPPVQTTYYEPVPGPAPVVIEAPPPAPIVEVRPAVPFAGAVWLPGYWTWHGRHHVWVGGRWSAPRAGYAWEPHRWVHEGRGWRMEPGHWRR